jgi:hypothetical protein
MYEGNILFLGQNEVEPTTVTGILQDDAFLSSPLPETKPRYKTPRIVNTTISGDEIAITPSADPDENTAPWLIKATDDLDQIMNLPDNWDSYKSPSISFRLLMNAKNFLSSLEFENVSPPRVVPVSGGGIQFEWQYGNRELEVEFVEESFVGYLKVVNDQPTGEGQFSISDYDSGRLLIKWLRPRQF